MRTVQDSSQPQSQSQSHPSTNDAYYKCSKADSSGRSIEGLYTFHSATTILRIAHALGELDTSVIDMDADTATEKAKTEVLEVFFERLNLVELELESGLYRSNPNPQLTSSIVVVEGLDGSGKSSLVEHLARNLNSLKDQQEEQEHQGITAVAWATPTDFMATVRPVFDKRGGPVARSFYMVSNYMLQYEIQQYERGMEMEMDSSESNQGHTHLIHIVDRWYTSTVAYSVAWKNTTGGVESSVDSLSPFVFSWPRNLRPPDLLVLLQVDDTVRRDRVKARNTSTGDNENNFNPWDERLDQDDNLGKRIMRAFERVGEQLELMTTSNAKATTRIVRLNANQSKQKVLEDAVLEVLSQRRILIRNPLAYFEKEPLKFFTWVSSELELCHLSTGHRQKHAPWAMQIAWNPPTAGTKADATSHLPILKTVGIHTVDQTGIIFFMRNHVESGDNKGAVTPASIVWNGGEYPFEQQWRAEGFLLPISMSEYNFMNLQPPPSLVAYTAACDQSEDKDDNHGAAIPKNYILEAPGRLFDAAKAFRKDPPPASLQDRVLRGTRFIPIRIEVLMGGPSSPDGPHRYEWTRGITNSSSTKQSNTDDNDNESEQSGWSKPRPILPFRPPDAPRGTHGFRGAVRGLTVAMTGTHCSGKKTLGLLVAKILGFSFQAELGELLRDHPDLVPGGHRVGDGSGVRNAQSWDDRVYDAELARDNQHESRRVVETWHVGNLAWAGMRLDAAQKAHEAQDTDGANEVSTEHEHHYQRVRSAIKKEQSRRCVLAVHLCIGPSDSVRRRQNDSNASRLPIEADMEFDECNNLYQALDVKTQQYLGTLGIPLLVIENSDDGQDAIKATARKIVTFINEHQWRRAF
jgi:thymidylate kinase